MSTTANGRQTPGLAEPHGTREAADRLNKKPQGPPTSTMPTSGFGLQQLPDEVNLQQAAVDSTSLTQPHLLRLQRTVGNRAVSELLSRAAPRPATQSTRHADSNRDHGKPSRSHDERPRVEPSMLVQRLAASQAYDAAVTRASVDKLWYNRILIPALAVIAARSGTDLDGYLAPMSEQAFLAKVQELRKDFAADPQPFYASFLSEYSLIDSNAYPGKKRVKDTNILVDKLAAPKDRITPELRTFIQNYKAGHLVWYRGLNISHFSWGILQAYGTLASEGTADIPTFTMGNNIPTRWLPGLYDRNLALGVARSIPATEPGLRALTNNQEMPTAALLRFSVSPTTPIAYLNDGEQVVRGPIDRANVIVDTVILFGPSGYRDVAPNSQPTDLPPQCPYQAAVNSPTITAWAADAQEWIATH